MTLYGIGTDLVDNARLGRAMERLGQPFLDRIFTAGEQEYCQSHADPLPHFAARFAAKEAVAKAFRTGIGESASFREIEVVRHPNGAPGVRLHGSAAAYAAHHQLGEIHLSLSHTSTLAIAYVVVLTDCCPSASFPPMMAPV